LGEWIACPVVVGYAKLVLLGGYES